MNPVPPPPREQNARRHGRVRAQTITCTLGDVVDVSASGMKVRCSSKPELKKGDRVPMTIHGVNGPFTVPTRFAWCRRTSLFKWTAGFEFDGLTPEARAELMEIARIAAIGEVVRPPSEHIIKPY